MTSGLPRKRALIACEVCRKRKRKCNGLQPCANCVQLGSTTCSYPDAMMDRLPIDATTGYLANLHNDLRYDFDMFKQFHTEQLAALEQKIESLKKSQVAGYPDLLKTDDPRQNHFSSVPTSQPFAKSPASTKSSTGHYTSSAMGDNQEFEDARFFIPQEHTTSTNWLLSLPKIRELLGRPESVNFHSVEVQNELPQELSYDSRAYPTRITPENNEAIPLIEDYFRAVNMFYPVLTLNDRDGMLAYDASIRFADHSGPQGVQDALRLLVCALGKLVTRNSSNQESRALQFFASAMHIINDRLAWSFNHSIKLAQALVLAASFLAHMGRPLHSWQYAQQAFYVLKQTLTKEIIRKLDGPTLQPDDSDYLILDESIDDAQRRVYWSCFLIECDRVAEFELARSGVEDWAETFPQRLQPPDHETLGFAAEIHIRKTLNSIHSTLYPKSISENSPAAAKYLDTADSLNTTLDAWYQALPKVFMFSTSPESASASEESVRTRVLRIRYYAAQHIINRVFLLHVVAHPYANYSKNPNIMKHASSCITACKLYLKYSTDMQRERTPYLWTFSISSIGALLVLTIANSTRQLQHMTVDELPSLRELVYKRLRIWQTPGSSFEAAIEIIESLCLLDDDSGE